MHDLLQPLQCSPGWGHAVDGVGVAYSVSYTGSDGVSGTLPGLTTTSTVDLPVAEVQTLTTNSNNPHQN